MTNLTELIKDREELVKHLRINNDKSHEILAEELYNKPTQFITELLQNAEDEGATSVEFHLAEDELIFSHDANRLFDFKDIRAISNFGDNQEKKEKPNAIGRFGIGFKSVYSITHTPRIVSGEYDITIIDYIIPKQNDGHSFYDGTKIILPFNHKKRPKNEIYDLIKKEIQDLKLEYLLFLSNIKTVKWSVGPNAGSYKRTKRQYDKRIQNLFTVSLKKESRTTKYIVLEKEVSVDQKNLTTKIAFKIDSGKIQPAISSPLYAFFPTDQETALKFLVHAPYLTTPARDNIESDPRNEILTKELGILLSESLTTFKQLNLLKIDLLNILPIIKNDCTRSNIYSTLFASVKEELESGKKLIPTSDGGYSAVKNSMLIGSSHLIKLLNKKQRERLFNRREWVDTGITADKTRELREYLFVELDLPEYDLNSFARSLDLDFIKQQPDNWLIHFYSIIHSTSPRLWEAPKSKYDKSGILRTKPIIRTENEEHVVPFQEDGKPNVYLPTASTNYPTVKRSIAKNKKAEEFFKDWGLTPPDVFDEINEFILPTFNGDEISPEYSANIEKIIDALDSSDQQEKRNRLIQDLRNYSFIWSINYESGEITLKKYNEVYFLTEEMKVYFSGNDSAFFVDEPSLSEKRLSKLQSILKEVGVKNYPLRIEFYARLTSKEKHEIRLKKASWYNGRITSEKHCTDYELNGLTYFLKEKLTHEKSVILWQLLLKCISGKSKHSARQFFEGSYAWKYYNNYEEKFDSFFLKQLKSTPWLVFENDESNLPSDLSLSDLPNAYTTDTEEAEIFAEILGFKPSEVQIIEEKYGGKFISKEDYEELEELRKWKAQQEKSDTERGDESEFKPEFQPDDISPVSRELESQETTNRDYSKSRQTDNDSEKRDSSNTAEQEQSDRDSNPKRDKQIGIWGESFVEQSLLNELKGHENIEIVNLNKSGMTGVGCDFIVKQNDQIIRLIEVKSTTESFGKPLRISGSQWETARSYFKVNDGDKYWIYCVFNTGKHNAEIVTVQNPIKKWKDGKLFADPIDFIVKNESK